MFQLFKNAVSRTYATSTFNLTIITIVAAIGAFYCLTLHEGHSWSGDFSQYIHHAKNLVEGKHYVDTGYIVSGSSSFVGPYAYPPVFPALLAPVYWLNGLDFEAMKLVPIISLCLFLLLLPKLFNSQLSQPQKVIIIFLTGANPFFWTYSNEILSDFSFILFSYLALYQMQQLFLVAASNQNRPPQYIIMRSCWLGAIMYLAYGSREIGIILPLCVLTYEIIIKRKVTAISMVSVIIFLGLAYLQHHLLNENLTPITVQQNLIEFSHRYAESSTVGHLDFISLDPQAIISRIQRYRWAMQAFLPFNQNPAYELINSMLFNLVMLLAFAGYLITLLRKISVLEIFFAGYVAVLLLFGAPTYTRYLLPLFPLTLYYALITYQCFLDSKIFASYRYPIKNLLSVGLLAIASLSYAYALKNPNYDVIDSGIEHPQAVEMLNFIRNNTEANDTIVFKKPRVMSLLTQRASIGDPRFASPTPERINQFFTASEADYYVDFKLHKWMRPLTETAPPTSRFQEVFSNDYFAVYQYSPAR